MVDEGRWMIDWIEDFVVVERSEEAKKSEEQSYT
jgi:hypothetical protein